MSYRVLDLGIVDFLKTYRIQKQLVEELKSNEGRETLIFCEHNPVFTLGRRARLENILADSQTIEKRGIQVFRTDRGGDVTYHGPGQIILYPILNLKRHRRDILWYLRKLEQTTIDLLAGYGIDAYRHEGFAPLDTKHLTGFTHSPESHGCKPVDEWLLAQGFASRRNPAEKDATAVKPWSFTGVWVDGKKIASVGIGISGWITYHGLALNVNTDLTYFSMIRPCNLDVEITSMSEILEKNLDLAEIKRNFLEIFNGHFNTEQNKVKIEN